METLRQPPLDVLKSAKQAARRAGEDSHRLLEHQKPGHKKGVYTNGAGSEGVAENTLQGRTRGDALTIRFMSGSA